MQTKVLHLTTPDFVVIAHVPNGYHVSEHLKSIDLRLSIFISTSLTRRSKVYVSQFFENNKNKKDERMFFQLVL